MEAARPSLVFVGVAYMTTTPLLIKLAGQGDAAAITALMNAALLPQNIRVKTRLEGHCLQVMLRSPNVLNQHASVAFIRRGLLRLQADTIHSVRAYAWHLNQDFPIWIVEFDLTSVAKAQTPKPIEPFSVSQGSQEFSKEVPSQAIPAPATPTSPTTVAPAHRSPPTSGLTPSKRRPSLFGWGFMVMFAVVVYWMAVYTQTIQK